MKASELRTGNYIKDIHEPNLIFYTDVDLSLFSGLESGAVEEDDLKPIPLTKDWLIRFEFNLNENLSDESEQVYENDLGYRVSYYKTNFFFGMSYDDYNVALLYVHQLQNLYFALTGEELTVK